MITIPVFNMHRRTIAADLDSVGKVIDSLGGPQDLLWPAQDWMPMRLDGPMELGTTAGHGPGRYYVVGYQPGRWIRFEQTHPGYMQGFHEFSAHPAGPNVTVLQHLLAMRFTPLGWPIYPTLLRVVHDTIIEMAMDCAERATTGWVHDPVRPSLIFKAQKALLRGSLKLSSHKRHEIASEGRK